MFFYAANRHARVFRLNYHAHTGGFQLFLDEFSNCMRHPFLYLRSTSHFFDHTSQLAQSCDMAFWDVTDMSNPSERQQVMLTHAGKRDITNEDKLVILFSKGDMQMPCWIEM
ncbi:hypothetical protein HG15A2_01540 [Adhaeretor mobilis]|uniref:Uncharacterized protein n=1 Tax=Adhaeretor mobilis TaxID=1930276 RepID=A0A517MPT2_9BACT|nr:hypothetical protein HG15A2_01540 [Adhaeretor mobilis]